jgi:hypothetical protein
MLPYLLGMYSRPTRRVRLEIPNKREGGCPILNDNVIMLAESGASITNLVE